MLSFKTLVLGLTCSMILTGCGSASSKGSSTEEVIIYSNADVEAVEVIQEVLDQAGYEGQYIFQSFGTGELGAGRALVGRR